MKKPRLSLRWRLTLVSWSLALGTALVLTVLLHLRTQRQLFQQLEKTLQTRVDEVITVLESGASHPTLEEFLLIETKAAETYFYDIRDAQGRVLARSKNLGGAELPLPADWRPGDAPAAVRIRTEPHPISPSADRIRLLSERVRVVPAGRAPATVVIQTAVSLAPFESTVRQTLRDALVVAIGGLSGVFFLLWFVTTRALQPVAAITRKASQITATKLRERLPLAGRGDELDELATVLNEMLDRLAGSLRQMEQFSSDAAHQLRTPLTRIRGELDLVLRSDVSEPSQDCTRLGAALRARDSGVSRVRAVPAADMKDAVSTKASGGECGVLPRAGGSHAAGTPSRGGNNETQTFHRARNRRHGRCRSAGGLGSRWKGRGLHGRPFA